MEILIHRKGKTHVVKFDDADIEIVSRYKWNIQAGNSGIFYARGSEIGNMRNRVYMHRIIMAPLNPGELIDHSSGDGLDNRRANLRKCSRRQNAYNSRPQWSRDSKGAEKSGERWVARIVWEGIRLSMGRYKTKEEAVAVYDKVASRLHGEFARLNYN